MTRENFDLRGFVKVPDTRNICRKSDLPITTRSLTVCYNVCFRDIIVDWFNNLPSLSVIRDSAEGMVVLPPVDSIVLSGQHAHFHCRTDLPFPVTWYLNSIIPRTSEDIFSGKIFTNDMQSRYGMNITSDGRQFTLVINEADEMHAGLYECKDNDGFGEPVSAELVVLG